MSEPDCPQKAPIIQADVEPGEYWYCSCGKSASQPFCDGSHSATEFTPMQVKVEEKRTIAWCACKRSGNQPFCDGSHSKL